MAQARFIGKFRRLVAKKGIDLAKVERAGVAAAAVFGQPHLHSGRGIRRLGTRLYEARLGRDWRLVGTWWPETDEWVFQFFGTHSEVQRYLQNLR